ncbi:hypothetical protein SDRG_07225 [Saprolegnia diclina VS20]|uniref:Ricin B lectin domain-containing protein n=1 Tax=Saprolegnia diclina (strain VS20) TaxID=1156394 RepID=T0RYZ9_SAPDV|nr:hypothetical protein SDRG_07225 [Saprolegnia diclina VS20]EQC35517.1 hypothetical protein SDRG_07225 [Saprolegnia diclina VS20]|eukprot:XP_008611267.1 hypothetical protein SDRG_07225 [Saprolegnia diclina VS20]
MAKWTFLTALASSALSLHASVAQTPCANTDPFEIYETTPCGNNPTPAPATTTLTFCAYNRQALSEYNGDIFTDVVRTNKNEQFVYSPSAMTLVSESNGQCLDAYLDGNGAYQLHTYQCMEGNGNQKWVYNTNARRIEHGTHQGLCVVGGSAGTKARVEPCSQSLLQYFSDCKGSSSVSVHLQTCYTDSWLSEYDTGLYADKLRNNANENFAYDPVAQTLQVGSNGQCLDAFSTGDGKFGLHTYACDAKNSNQKWILQDKLVKHATFNNLCLDADPTDNSHKAQVWDCTAYNKNQCWNILRV